MCKYQNVKYILFLITDQFGVLIDMRLMNSARYNGVNEINY